MTVSRNVFPHPEGLTMRRTLRLESFGVSGVAPGELVVASMMGHPTRGPVCCLAAAAAAPVYVLAPGPDRHDTRSWWANRGVRPADRLADIPDGATVVFPAHGVDLRVSAEAEARGLRVVDATCPLVARAQATA